MVAGMFKDWGKGTEPPEWATKVEVQEMMMMLYENIIVMLQLSVSVLVGLFLHFSLRVFLDLLE